MKLRATGPGSASARSVTIDQSQPLGAGGEGEVFADQGTELVYKIYRKPTREHHDKVRAMLDAAPDHCFFNRSNDPKRHAQIAWPQEILHDAQGKRFIGYSMPRCPSDTVSLDKLFVPYNIARFGLEDANFLRTRLYIARNLSSIVSYIHKAGHIVIDIKPQNIQLYSSGGFCCFLDCDGFTISGRDGSVFPAKVITPEFLAPEHFHSGIGQMGPEQDHYGLAVILHRLINNNLHPTDGVPLDSVVPTDQAAKAQGRHFAIDPSGLLAPHKLSLFDYLDDDTQHLFQRAFLGMPDDRPTASEWRRHLDELISRVQQCSANPLHDRFSKGCGYCRTPLPPGSQGGGPSTTAFAGQGSAAAKATGPAPGAFSGIFATWSQNPPGAATASGGKPGTGAPGAVPGGRPRGGPRVPPGGRTQGTKGPGSSPALARLLSFQWLPWKLRGALRRPRIIMFALFLSLFTVAVQSHQWVQDELLCLVRGGCPTHEQEFTFPAPDQLRTPRKPRQPTIDERRYFDKVLEDNLCPGFKAYLRAYPNGAYTLRANEKLQELGCR